MAKSFRTLRDNISPERREQTEYRVQETLKEMALKEMRADYGITQQELATTLGLSQAALSKMEHQDDMQIGTLRRILAAMGAEMKIIASFPEGDVVINQFKATKTASSTLEIPASLAGIPK